MSLLLHNSKTNVIWICYCLIGEGYDIGCCIWWRQTYCFRAEWWVSCFPLLPDPWRVAWTYQWQTCPYHLDSYGISTPRNIKTKYLVIPQDSTVYIYRLIYQQSTPTKRQPKYTLISVAAPKITLIFQGNFVKNCVPKYLNLSQILLQYSKFRQKM